MLTRELSILIVFELALATIGLREISAAAIDTSMHPGKGVWIPDNGDGTYRNPIIYADYSDPDVIRVDEDYYMVSSSFNCSPGLPILHSKDLVNWRIAGHVFQRLPSTAFDTPQHGKGCWAPSIRFHNGEFYVYYGDPDRGIFMSKSKNPAGPWESLLLIKDAVGWIDPCPLWDDDGKAYLVHAWAKSRAGFNSILTVHRMSNDGQSILDSGVTVFDGHGRHPTIEGPKFYKRNGYYYIFAPAGGVPKGWQTVLRSGNAAGPYEDRIVLDQGSTAINGPHQGGWIETESGESWFIHFQDRNAYGRIVHLQPMTWKDDWPVIGLDGDGNGKGEPVLRWKNPAIAKRSYGTTPQTSDEFDADKLGLQWQWPANWRENWYSLKSKKGILRLNAIPIPQPVSTLWAVPNLLLQKFPAPAFSVRTFLTFNPAADGETSGLVVMGLDYAFIAITKTMHGYRIVQAICQDADKGSKEQVKASASVTRNSIHLRVDVDSAASCKFKFSEDGKNFLSLGGSFTARQGVWIGAKVGLFSIAPAGAREAGSSDIDWLRIE